MMGPELYGVFFGVASAVSWGAADFCGGSATRRSQVLAGVGFGAFLICLDQAAENAVFWPLIAARATSLGLLIVANSVMGKSILPDKKRLPLIVLTGVLDTGGSLLYMLAAGAGRLDVAAVLASLYPAATLLLARFALHEHFSRLQLIGILAALSAVLLIAV